jgi:hypothetical protein
VDKPGHSGKPIPAEGKIELLLGKHLKTPLDTFVEERVQGYRAHPAGLHVYAYGDDPCEAIEVLKEGLEQICLDCKDRSGHWRLIRSILNDNFIEK